MMIKLRGGTAAFQIETERSMARGSQRGKVCKECESGEVQDVENWLYTEIMANWQLSYCPLQVLSIISDMWHARFN